MLLALKALRINLVNILRAGWTRSKPSIFCNHFQAANGSIIAGCAAEYAYYLFAGQVLAFYPLRRERRQYALLIGGRGCVNPFGEALAELAIKLAVLLAGIAAHPC